MPVAQTPSVRRMKKQRRCSDLAAREQFCFASPSVFFARVFFTVRVANAVALRACGHLSLMPALSLTHSLSLSLFLSRARSLVHLHFFGSVCCAKAGLHAIGCRGTWSAPLPPPPMYSPLGARDCRLCGTCGGPAPISLVHLCIIDMHSGMGVARRRQPPPAPPRPPRCPRDGSHKTNNDGLRTHANPLTPRRPGHSATP